MCFTAGVYNDIGSDRSYTIIESVFHFNSDFIKSDFTFSSSMIFSSGIGSYYFLMFIPVISSLSFIINYDSEIKSGYWVYENYRVSINKKIFSNFLCGMVCGGIVVALSYFVFGFLIYILFPDINSYKIDEELKGFLLKSNYWTTVFKTIMGGFLYGSITAILSILLYELTNNIYVSLSLSFMIYYIYNSFLNKIFLDHETQMDLQILYPNSLLYFFNNKAKILLIMFYLSIIVISLGIYYILSIKKLKLQ